MSQKRDAEMPQELVERARVDVLSFAGCPGRDEAVRLVERVADELGLQPEIRLIEVPDPETAQLERFLGSPSIRVNGRDIEPGAEERRDYAHACRIYRTSRGQSGLPDEQWLRETLASGAR